MTPGVGGKKIKLQEKINIRKKCLFLKQLKKHFHRYLKICDPELLENSLHGQTQNVNESLNRIIWKKCPKNLLVLR